MPTLRERRAEGDPTRTPPPHVVGYHPGRPPWSAPKGRDLLAGVAILFVLAAVLDVMTRDRSPAPAPGAAEPFPRANAPAATPSAPPWVEVPVTTRVADLGGALSEPVASGLDAARARIERCVALERRRTAGPPADRGAADTELVLRLSPRSGAVHVVGVEERTAGRSAVLADCARRHLDGDTFPAGDAVPGRRYRLLVTLR